MKQKPTATFAAGPNVTGSARSRRPVGALCTLVSLLLVLVACGGAMPPALSPNAAPTATHHALATPAQLTPASSPTLGSVTWTTQVDPTTGAPADSVSIYMPDAPRLIAVFPAMALPAGSTIDATWLYNDTSLDAFNTRLALPDRVPKRWIDLHLSRKSDAPWPDGTYEVIVSLNGEEVQRAAVLVASDQ